MTLSCKGPIMFIEWLSDKVAKNSFCAIIGCDETSGKSKKKTKKTSNFALVPSV